MHTITTMVAVPAVPAVQWVQLRFQCVVRVLMSANVCFALTTPAPESTGVLGLSRVVMLWIIIGTALLLVVTGVCIAILFCIVVHKERADKRTFTPAVIQAVHGDTIRGIGPTRPVIDIEQRAQSTAEEISDAVLSQTQENIELKPLDRRQQPNDMQE